MTKVSAWHQFYRGTQRQQRCLQYGMLRLEFDFEVELKLLGCISSCYCGRGFRSGVTYCRGPTHVGTVRQAAVHRNWRGTLVVRLYHRAGTETPHLWIETLVGSKREGDPRNDMTHIVHETMYLELRVYLSTPRTRTFFTPFVVSNSTSCGRRATVLYV